MNAVVLAVLLVVVSVIALSRVDATYVKTWHGNFGYNLERARIPIPQQAHQIAYPETDTSMVGKKAVHEAAVACDKFAPVQRTVVCDIHTYDDCGNPYGQLYNLTGGWSITVEELEHPGAVSRLVAPIIWLEKGVGRFYFTPTRRGLHRVVLTRNIYPLVADLQHARDIGLTAGFVVHVHDQVVKGLSHNIGQTNAAVQRMLWAAASRNAEPDRFMPAMPPTTTFEDKEHRFDNRKWGLLQEATRRAPVQPEAFPKMPNRPARYDDNGFRLVDVARP